MKPLRTSPRRALLCLALACLVLPAAVSVVRYTVFFEATFDTSGSAGGGALPAEVGQFALPAQPAEFSVVPVSSGGGQLKIEDGGTIADAVLVAQFKKPFKGPELDLAWTVQPMQTDATLIVSAQDAGDTGLIDCTYDDDGRVRVDGVDIGYPYHEGYVYHVKLTLKDPLAGAGQWTLDIDSPGEVPFHATGSFDPSPTFIAQSLHFTRPANDHPGKFLVDEIHATALCYGANY